MVAGPAVIVGAAPLSGFNRTQRIPALDHPPAVTRAAADIGGIFFPDPGSLMVLSRIGDRLFFTLNDYEG